MVQDKLIKRMLEADFYPPESVKQPIEMLQTHCSIVFLTGDYAYKIKKIVDFGFLDYSTLAKRHHFLNAELEMNRALAPDLYLEVLPIYQQDDDFHWHGEGEIVEYALKMNQFPQENLLINVYESGNLTTQHMKELGKLVAKFHQNTPTNEYITSFGSPEKIAESITQNYQQTLKYIGIAQSQRQYEETKAFTDNFLVNQRNILEKRQIDGKVRECHGDLHVNYPAPKSKIYGVGFLPKEMLFTPKSNESYSLAIGFAPRSVGQIHGIIKLFYVYGLVIAIIRPCAVVLILSQFFYL